MSVKEVNKAEMEVEQRGGEEVLTFMDVKDCTDPLNVKQNNSFSNLAITSPKDTPMSDDDVTDENENCKAEAEASLVTKVNPDSNTSPQADAITKELASAADVYLEEEEKKDINTETAEEGDDETAGEKEEEEEEKITKEVKGRSREEKKEEKKEEITKKGSSSGAVQMAARDNR